MSNDLLTRSVEAFNNRRYADSVALTAEGLKGAVGRDELFWMGLHEAAVGFELVTAKQPRKGEQKMIEAMEKLRHFGYRYENVEVTSVLAGLRRGIEEIRSVESGQKKMFDMTLLPQIKMSGSADER
jgi:hypothetical protein